MALNGTTPGLATLPTKAPGTVSALGAYAAPKPPVDYGQAFQNALGQARESIQQQLGAALGDIQTSQNAAGQALGQIPSGINAAYGQANGTIDKSLGTIAGAQKASGIGSMTPLSAYMQPERAAIQNSQAYAQSMVPMLGMGIQEEGARQRAMANMAAMGGNQQLDQATMQNASQQGNALQNYNYQKQLQDDPNRNFGASATSLSAPVIDQTTGLARGFTQGDVQTVMKSQPYQRSVKLITDAQANSDPEEQKRVWADLSQHYANNPAMLAALSAAFPGGKPPPAPTARKPITGGQPLTAKQAAAVRRLNGGNFQWGL